MNGSCKNFNNIWMGKRTSFQWQVEHEKIVSFKLLSQQNCDIKKLKLQLTRITNLKYKFSQVRRYIFVRPHTSESISFVLWSVGLGVGVKCCAFAESRHFVILWQFPITSLEGYAVGYTFLQLQRRDNWWVSRPSVSVSVWRRSGVLNWTAA